MRIAVSSTGKDLSSRIDPRFGRSPFFLIIDTETMEFEVIENPNVDSPGGAGIETAQLIANRGAEAVITGSCGPNAFQTLQAAGVKVIVGIEGTVREAVERFKSDQFQSATQPNVQSHYGMGYGVGPGFGRGMGRGMGCTPFSWSVFPSGIVPPSTEIETLRQYAQFLQDQLNQIKKSIEELEGEKK
ncbi:MAG: NifB/NifX family molybdenum-iron cluster-binding protein [Thermodesulfobacteriota bacterium]